MKFFQQQITKASPLQKKNPTEKQKQIIIKRTKIFFKDFENHLTNFINKNLNVDISYLFKWKGNKWFKLKVEMKRQLIISWKEFLNLNLKKLTFKKKSQAGDIKYLEREKK